MKNFLKALKKELTWKNPEIQAILICLVMLAISMAIGKLFFSCPNCGYMTDGYEHNYCWYCGHPLK